MDLYQGPVYDQIHKSHVFWVGLSAVLFNEGEVKLPLSPLTPSGTLIQSIETPLRTQFSFYKTNLVKCAPLKENKVRYPLEHEMEKCFPNFEWELAQLKPHTIFLLGKQVADFVMKKLAYHKSSFNEDFKYGTVEINGINFIPIHHPSYILVYKRKHLQQYVKSIQKLLPVKDLS